VLSRSAPISSVARRVPGGFALCLPWNSIIGVRHVMGDFLHAALVTSRAVPHSSHRAGPERMFRLIHGLGETLQVDVFGPSARLALQPHDVLDTCALDLRVNQRHIALQLA
jgi:hypothetical protein